MIFDSDHAQRITTTDTELAFVDMGEIIPRPISGSQPLRYASQDVELIADRTFGGRSDQFRVLGKDAMLVTIGQRLEILSALGQFIFVHQEV